MTIILWTLYPIVWIVAEGQRMVSASMEACLYAIMDVSAKCVFGIIIVQARGALESITGRIQICRRLSFEPLQCFTNFYTNPPHFSASYVEQDCYKAKVF